MLQKGLLGFLVLLVPLVCNGQQARLEGFVTAAGAQGALPGAGVKLIKAGVTTIADSAGAFRFTSLPLGPDTLVATFIGFHTFKKALTLSPGRNHLDVSLLEESHQLDEVEVQGLRRPEAQSAAQATLNREALEKRAGLTLGEALASEPGISLVQNGPSIVKPMVRGLTGSRVLMMNGGVRHEGQQWGADHAPEADPLAQGTVRLVRGAATVRYGPDALGGAILLDPPAMRDSAGMEGRVALAGAANNGLGAASGLLLATPAALPSLRMRAQGTYRRAGDSRAPGYVLSNTGLEEAAGSGGAEWKR